MKLYSEDVKKAIRESFEEEIIECPYVKTKRMFGCPCLTVKDKLFAFLVTRGIVLTKLADSDREAAFGILEDQPYQHNQRVVTKWVRILVKNEKALQQIMLFISKSYENAIEQLE